MEKMTGIVQRVDFGLFCDAFRDHGRKDQFSYEAKKAIFDYLEALSDDIGEPIELDVVAICCEYNEDTPEEIAGNYSIELPEPTEAEEEQAEGEDYIQRRNDTVQEYLQEHTQFIGRLSDNSMVYAAF